MTWSDITLVDPKPFDTTAAVQPNGATHSPALSVRDISVRFSGIQACSNVSFDIDKGETLAIIGPNGAGKTTLVNAITGAVSVEAGGSVVLYGDEGVAQELVAMRPDLIVQLGMIRTFQNVLLIPNLSVRDNVMLGRYVHQRTGIFRNMLGSAPTRRERAAHRARVDEILDGVGLLAYAASDPSELAYGLKKRVELARALASEPQILLLDEPVAGMSLEERKEMAELVRLTRRSRRDMAVLLIEHDMRFVMSLADRVMAINQGRVLATGTPAEIQAHPLVREAYLGAS